MNTQCPVTSAELGFHSRYFKVRLYYADLLDHHWEWVHVSPQAPALHTLQTPPALTALMPISLLKEGLRPQTRSHSSSFWMASNRVNKCLGLSQVALPGTDFWDAERKEGLWNKHSDHVKLRPVKGRLTCLTDWISAQHQTESYHLKPTETSQRNYFCMAIYYERILGAPPPSLPERLWKWPEVNLVFQTFQEGYKYVTRLYHSLQDDRAPWRCPSSVSIQPVCENWWFTFHKEIQLQSNTYITRENAKQRKWLCRSAYNRNFIG